MGQFALSGFFTFGMRFTMPFALGVLAAAYAGARGELDGAAIWMAAITIVLIVAPPWT